MIDAVVTWVDGEDPQHLGKREKYKKCKEDQWTHTRADHATRFTDSNEIWYCIHAIRKFASYVDKIYLVTDQQRPGWLTDRVQQNLKVEIVDHSIIFQGYEQYLPTFNSRTIETMLYRVPGIKDNFLYFNDDVVLISPTRKADYFRQDQLVYRGEWLWKLNLKKRLTGLLPLDQIKLQKLTGTGYIGYRNEDKYFKRSRYLLFRLAHSPYPMNKEICKQLFSSQEKLASQIKYRFKNRQQYSPISLGANLAFKVGRAKKGANDYGYLAGGSLSKAELEQWLRLFERNRSIKSLCIQSLDQAGPAVEKSIKAFLQERLEK